MSTENQSGSNRQYDHAAIRADLETIDPDTGKKLSVAAISQKHGCSPSLVQRIRRDARGDGETVTRAQQRAIQCRKRKGHVEKDIALVKKWLPNEAKVETKDGKLFGGLTTLLGLLEEIQVQLDEAADLFEALPETATKIPRGASAVTYEPGMVVKVRDKHREEYAGLLTHPDHLEVQKVRNQHLAVQDGEQLLFIPRAHVCPVTDERDE